MPIISFKTENIGEAGQTPKIIYIGTDDTDVEILAPGYLNKIPAQGVGLSEIEIALVATKPTPITTHTAFYNLSFSNGNWSLIPIPGVTTAITTSGVQTTGTATLVAGTVTVNTKAIKANSLVFLTYKNNGVALTNTGALSYGSIIPGVHFIITSTVLTDVNQVSYFIVNPL